MMNAQPPPPGPTWHSRTIQHSLLFLPRPIRPAEIGDALCKTILARENVLEDVNYRHIVPNRFVVELNEDNYLRNFQPIERQVIQQWIEKLLKCLVTTNSRLGKQAYRFGGRVQIALHPVANLEPHQARLLSLVQMEGGEAAFSVEGAACLKLLGSSRQWSLRPGLVRLGRDPSCEIYLDLPSIQERRLVSGQHAYLRSEGGQYRLFDGSPGGKPSVNGTYLNNQRVPASGTVLKDGDTILLAATDPGHPRADTPGVAALRFEQECAA